mgnify:FL=1|tara:strand:+ start:21 stop:782 length:762 start_codon:yes stop_codon:yes gene_type:complete
MTDILKQDLQDSVLELTINREDAGNALSYEVIGLLNDSLMQYRTRSDLRCVFIKGSGEKFFVAGGDVKELTSVKEDKETEEMALNGRAMLDQIRYFPVPVIANINGYALGGGAELAMACDYRIACETAKFGFIHSSLGITTAWGGMIDLIESIGSSKALSILIEGKMLSAEEARHTGIIQEVEKTQDALKVRINELIKIYQNTPIEVIRGIKAVNIKYKESIHELLKGIELDSFKKTWMSDEHWRKVEELLSK